MDDSVLLREYAGNGSEEAFAALVARHINLVYSVAFRQAGDAHHAEEITQAVFIILARKAGELRHDKALASWLFQTTRLTANNFLRSELRRQHREQEAFMQSTLNESGNEVWPAIAPWLDTAVAGLGETDRRAILLRFYEGKNMLEVGAALGASEDAAKKRVNRAVEKLRAFFTKRGVTVPAAVLTAAISANSVKAAPVMLGKTVTAAALAKGAVGGTSALLALAKGGAMMKSAGIFGLLGGWLALIGGAYVTWRAEADDTKSPRERRFMLQMIGVRMVACGLILAGFFCAPLFHFSISPFDGELLRAMWVFSVFALGMGLFAYSSRRRRQIQMEDDTFSADEWTLPRRDTDRVANPHETKASFNLKTLKFMALISVLSAVMIFQAPWRQHLEYAMAWSAINVGCLIWGGWLWQNRPRYLSLRLNWVWAAPLFIGLATLFFFNYRQYQPQTALDATGMATPGEVYVFNLMVTLAYVLLVGILIWKRKSERWS